MADIRIKDLTTLESASLTGDVFVIDGTTGTRKLSAFSPTFGGNATVTGTLTTNGNVTINSNVGIIGKSGTGTGGNWRFVSDDGTSRWLTGLLGGSGETSYSIYDSANSRSLLTATAAGVVQINQTTASTTTSTGALVVSGGLGLAGNLNMGGSLSVAGGSGISLDTTGSASLRFNDGASTKWWIYKLSGDQNLYIRDMVYSRMQMTFIPGLTSGNAISYLFSNLVVDSTAASTTTSTGALVVSGGVGVGGNITLGGGVNIAGAASDPLPAGTSGIWTLSGSGLRINSAGVTFASLTGTTLGTATVTVNGTTASTTTSTGALVVGNGTSGGLGVGGRVNIGENLNLSDPQALIHISGIGNTTGVKELRFQRSDNGDFSSFGLTGSAYSGGLTGLGNSETYIYSSSSSALRVFIGTASTNRFDFTSSQFKINPTTASTSTSSGALVVSGGVGVAGAINAGDQIKSERTSGTDTASAVLGVLTTTGAGVTNSFGIDARVIVNNSSGTTTSATGLRALSRVSNVSTVTQAVAMLAQVDNPGGGTITTAYGLYVNPITAGGTNYAIYTGGGRINFQSLPTSSAGLAAGTIWNDGGTLKVA